MSSGGSLFHSFPRQKSSSTADEIVRGLGALEMMLDIGLLLNHERIEYPMVMPGGIVKSGGSTVDQLRCCFTLIDQAELTHHSSLFGAFSFEFSLEKLRHIGAFPVIYIPNPVEDVSGRYVERSAVGNNIVHQIRDIAVLLEEIVNLQAAITEIPEGGTSIRFELNGCTREFDRKSANTLLDYLLGAKGSFLNLLDAVTILTNMFYFSEKASPLGVRLGKSVEYYLQREWRIVSGLIVGGVDNDRDLSLSESESLERHSRFFSSSVKLKNGNSVPQSRISRALVAPHGGSVLDLCERLHVPDCAVSNVEGLLRKRGMSIEKVEPLDYRQVCASRASV